MLNLLKLCLQDRFLRGPLCPTGASTEIPEFVFPPALTPPGHTAFLLCLFEGTGPGCTPLPPPPTPPRERPHFPQPPLMFPEPNNSETKLAKAKLANQHLSKLIWPKLNLLKLNLLELYLVNLRKFAQVEYPKTQ